MRIAGIKNNDIVDIDSGIAVSLWMQGCDHHCFKCQNPQTWDKNGGYEIDINVLLDQLTEAISANGIQRDFSILGGEPLTPYNKEYTNIIISEIKRRFPNIKIYLWTGYTYEYLMDNLNDTLKNILVNVDTLIEGPFILSQRDISLPLRGSRNQRVMVHDKNLPPECFKNSEL